MEKARGCGLTVILCLHGSGESIQTGTGNFLISFFALVVVCRCPPSCCRTLPHATSSSGSFASNQGAAPARSATLRAGAVSDVDLSAGNRFWVQRLEILRSKLGGFLVGQRMVFRVVVFGAVAAIAGFAMCSWPMLWISR